MAVSQLPEQTGALAEILEAFLDGNSLETGGLPCGCGRRGCLEAYCSVRRISDDSGVPLKEFFRRAEAHEPECETLLYDVLRHLGTGVNNIRLALARWTAT